MKKSLIIAEVGLNHNGDFNLAAKSVIAAAKSGADAVKFQNFITEDFQTDKLLTYTYFSQGKEITESFFDLCKRNEFKREWFKPLFNLCKEHGVEFISTPTSESGVDDLKEIGCKYIKNGSDYLTHTPLIKYMASSGMELILSTGMADEEDIDIAVNICKEMKSKFKLLHCTSNYPTSPIHTNLLRMTALRDKYNIDIGFSDHTESYQAAVQAIALGASVIEKHFTISHDLPGPDHWFSVTPDELSEYVLQIRNAEQRMGAKNFSSVESEDTKSNNRIGVVASRDLEKNTILNKSDFTFKKPIGTIKPNDISKFIGLKLNKKINKYSPLNISDFFGV